MDSTTSKSSKSEKKLIWLWSTTMNSIVKSISLCQNTIKTRCSIRTPMSKNKSIIISREEIRSKSKKVLVLINNKNNKRKDINIINHNSPKEVRMPSRSTPIGSISNKEERNLLIPRNSLKLMIPTEQNLNRSSSKN